MPCNKPRFSGLRPLLALAVLAAGLSLGACGRMGPGPGVTGNDTGGIIPWSPMSRKTARAMAAEHCAQYDKYARFTGAVPHYGGYLSFACLPKRHWR
jgi:hypothetical protein